MITCGSYNTISDDSYLSHSVSVTTAQSGAHFGEGTLSIWLDEVHCSGSEMRLFDCAHIGIGNHNCQHNQDAGVVCQSECVVYVRLHCIDII